MTKAEEEMAKKHKKAKLQKATKTRSMLGGATAKVEMHPELKRSSRGAPMASIHEEEEPLLEAVVVFGRMNPPTAGHERLIKEALSLADYHWQAHDVDARVIVILSKTLNENNPLSYKRRVELVREALADEPNAYVLEEDCVRDYLSLFKFIAEHFDHANFFVGSDRFADVNRMLEDYNGRDFEFESYGVSLIERDPDSENLTESVSASRMRELASAKELSGFTKGLPERLRSRAPEIMFEVADALAQQRYLKEEQGLRKVAKSAIINRKN